MTAIATQGTTIKIGDGASPEVFTAIAGVRDIGGLGGGSAAEIDITTLLSTAKEFAVGLPDEGTVTLELNYDPTDITQKDLEDARDDQTLTNFQIITPSAGATFAFAGYVTTFEKSFGADNVIIGNVQIRISGIVTKT